MKAYKGRWIGLFCGILLLGASVALFRAEAGRHGGPGKKPEVTAPVPVSVIRVTPETVTPEITGRGEVKARYELHLTSEVAGKVIKVLPELESGNVVAAGTVLARVEDTEYRKALLDARSSLETTKIKLLEEEREAERAESEWKRAGMTGSPSSALVWNTPQVKAAKAAVKAAQAAVALAEQNLSRTVIRAPFAAVVIARHVVLGSVVTAGSEIVTLASSDRVEVRISLSSGQWALLPDDATLCGGHRVQLASGGDIWEGHVIRVERHLNATTRQRSLVVGVSSPYTQNPPLLPGRFVTATLDGAPLPHIRDLPATARGEDGRIWRVTEENTLQAESVVPVAWRGDRIFVPAPAGESRCTVVSRALSSYLSGMRVAPQEEK